MAKKKKHHKKLRNSRKQRAAQGQIQKESLPAVSKTPAVVTKITTNNENTAPVYDDVELGYVKSDVVHTLTLVAIILSLYALAWVVLTYTSAGTQLTKLFIH